MFMLVKEFVPNNKEKKTITGMEVKCYLSNRTQLVEINHKENHTIHKLNQSKALTITRGVIQESILSSVLYILLPYDFLQYLEEFCEAVMFASETA